MAGAIRVDRMYMKMSSLRQIRNRAKLYAAGVPMTMTSRVVETDTMIELRKFAPNPFSVKASQ